jgi:signal transduction histidine kinase
VAAGSVAQVRERRYALFPSTVALALTALTVTILLVPYLSFSWYAPRMRLPLETASVFAAMLTAAMAYLRYSLGRRRSWLLISLAFLVIGLNQIVFGLMFSPGDIGVEAGAYLWISARLLAGALLLFAAFLHEEPGPPRTSSGAFIRTFSFVIGALILIQGLVWLLRNHLPPLVDQSQVETPRLITGFQAGLTFVDVFLGVVGAVLFLWAAAAFSRERGPEAEARNWLAAALVLAAFAHVHYMLVPTMLTNHISTGDFLRLAMSAVLLVALMVDVRRTYLEERRRALEMEKAYQAERARVVQLEELERAKVDLLRMLSHELLHPVAAIRALALGLAKASDHLGVTQRRSVEGLIHQSEQLRDLVERAPDITELRLGSLALQQESWRVDQILVHVRETFTHLGDRLVIENRTGARGATVEIDVARVMQVFHNLLSNAMKFSPAGAPITIRADVVEGFVRFEVRDRGPGVAPDRLDALFKPAPPVAPTGTQVRGLGVGLYISRLIVEAHGGRMWHDDAEEPGTGIVFTLPVGRPA